MLLPVRKLEPVRNQFPILRKLISADKGDLSNRKKPNIKGIKVNKRKMQAMDELIAEEFENGEQSLWRLNCLVYAGAMVISEGAKRFHKQEAPQSEAKRDLDIARLRKLVGQIHADLTKREIGVNLTSKQRKLRNSINKMCGSKSTKSLRVFLRKQKDLLRIRITQKKRYTSAKRRREINARYRKNGTKELSEKASQAATFKPPTKEEISEYWGRLLEDPGSYDLEDPNIVGWMEDLKGLSHSEDPPLEDGIFAAVLRKGKNWKAAGRDGIAMFWWKSLPKAAQFLWQEIKRMIEGKRFRSG